MFLLLGLGGLLVQAFARLGCRGLGFAQADFEG